MASGLPSKAQSGGYVLIALLLAPYLRKFGKFTVSEFISDRFYSPTARMVAVICLIVASTTYVIGQMTGVGVAFGRFIEISNTSGLLIGACVVFAYAVLGGMKGVTYTQVAQYVVLIMAYMIPAEFILLQLTGMPIPAPGLFSQTTATGGEGSVYLLTKLDQIVTELGFASYTEAHKDNLNMVLFTLSLMIGTAGLPHVIVRFFTVPKVSDARWSAGWTLVFIALRFVTPGQRHCGEDRPLLAERHRVYETARAAHPERWSGNTRNWQPAGSVWLNPERPDVGRKGHGVVDALPHKAGGGGPMAGPAERAA